MWQFLDEKSDTGSETHDFAHIIFWCFWSIEYSIITYEGLVNNC